MAHLKRAVWDSLKKNGLDIFEALDQDDDEGDDEESDSSTVEQKLDERDEDNVGLASSKDDHGEGDKFSMTSHLDSASDDSEFTASDFDLAKPGRPTTTNDRNELNQGLPLSPERAPNLPPSNPHGLPLSVLSPDPYETEFVGRRFPWGFADPLDTAHCDFTKLKSMVFSDWRGELKLASTELWYEEWRTSRLNKKARRNATISLGAK